VGDIYFCFGNLSMKKVFILFSLPFIMASCVTSKVYKDLQGKYADIEFDNSKLRKENDSLASAGQLSENYLQEIQGQQSALQKKAQELTTELESFRGRYTDLNQSYEYLLENNNNLLADNQRENKKLVGKLNTLQNDLARKEDSLRNESDRLQGLEQAVQSREVRINELESAMSRKDSVVDEVKRSLKNALLNFDGKGLTVETRDGKVYVSLENRLLFPSASWTVQAEGTKALQDLAAVLAENPDLRVMVEGHTDADAFKGRTAVKDNWDLSVMRATSIVKIITENPGVKKENIIAAGRSEYVPIAENETTEGKAKNRRTEIIITPDLSELSDILDK
jgi:chemotaxis protein MotB